MSAEASAAILERAAQLRPSADSFVRDQIFVGGQWVPAQGADWHPVHDCSTEVEIGRLRAASVDDVSNAVQAAGNALSGWRATAPEDRAAALMRLHDQLGRRTAELTAVISTEVGTALGMCLAIQVNSSLNQLELIAKQLTEHAFSEQIANTEVRHEPVGVVAAITPWNYPLFQTMAKVAGALAAGCTVVHKPSEMAPLSSVLLAEAVAAAELPAGVYNLVTGTGPAVGEALVGHPLVRLVSFTGSTAAGTRVYELAARSIKRVALELGGKSASVVLDDADLARAVKSSVGRAFLNSGQTCDAWTRLVLPHELADEAVDLARAAAARLALGDPFDRETRLGPLISAVQRERVVGHIDGAQRAGARVAVGGSQRPEQYRTGHYVEATVLTDVTPGMDVARQEVFGPVLALLTYRDETEALAIANGTDYGLSAAVWSGDPQRAEAFARELDAGQVVINGGGFNPAAPFGGVKSSGLGREMGRFGIAEFTEPKAYQR